MRGEVLESLRPARATIDLSRLAANYRAVAAAVPVPLMPVIKADAYGHGAVHVARHLAKQGAAMLAVAYVEEAVALRRAGIGSPLVVLSGFTAGQLPPVLEHDLVPVVGSRTTLELVTHRPANAPRLRVHLKVDTGMSR